MNKLDNEVINITKSFLTPPDDFDIKINNTLKTMYRRKTKTKSKFIKLYEKILKFFITLISFLSVTSLAGYAGYKIYDNYNQKQTEIDKKTENAFWTKAFDYGTSEFISIDNGIYLYKYIDNINEYNEYKEIIPNLPIMDEMKFIDNQILIITSREPKDGLKVEDVKVKDNKTVVTLSDKDMTGNYTKGYFCLSTIIPNELVKEIIKINVIPGTEYISKYNFIPMSEISINYILEQALEEGCIITDWENDIIYNEYKINDFIEKTNNNINSAIRHIQIYDEELGEHLSSSVSGIYGIPYIIIYDTIYENGIFNQYIGILSRDNIFLNSGFKKGGKEIITKEDYIENWWYVKYTDEDWWYMVHTTDGYRIIND